jgi:hypothetical protein
LERGKSDVWVITDRNKDRVADESEKFLLPQSLSKGLVLK